MQSEYFSVTGMHSNSCVIAVRRALSALPGVGQVHVSLTDGATSIHFNEKLIAPDRLMWAVEEAGYGVDQSGVISGRRPDRIPSESDHRLRIVR